MLIYLVYVILFISVYIALGSMTVLYIIAKRLDYRYIGGFNVAIKLFLICWPLFWIGYIIGIIEGHDE